MVALLLLLPTLLVWAPWPSTPRGGPTAEAPEAATSLPASERATLRLVAGTSDPPERVSASVRVDGEVVSRADGALPLALAIPTGGSVLVVVEAPGRARFAQRLDLDGDRTLRVPLPAGARITGATVDERGEPIEGAAVRVLREDGAAPLPWTTTTDAEGRFTIDTLTPGPHRLDVRASGHASATRAGVETGGEAVRLTLERVGQVAGRVMGPEGEAAPGATVVIAGSGLWPARQQATGEDGRFVFGEVPPGIYEVRAFSGSRVAEPRRGLSVEPGGRAFLTFGLRDGVTLTGVVRDTSGQPIADAEVTVAAEALDVAPRTATTDERGRFRVAGLQDAVHRVGVFAEGFVPVPAREWTPPDPIALELEPAAILSGVVLDEDRRPVEGATIEVLGEDEARQPVAMTGDRGFRAAVFEAQAAPLQPTSLEPTTLEPMALEVTSGPVPPIPVGSGPAELALTPLPEAPSEARLAASHRSDAEGRFRIAGVPPGRVQVVARSHGMAPATTERLFVAAGATRDDLELILPPAGRLLGRVLDQREQGVEAVLIEVRSDREPYPRVTFTDDRGGFELDGVVGELTVTAMPQGHPAVRARAEVLSDRDTEVRLDLEGELSTLRGRTVDGRGFPIGSVQLTVSSLRADAPHRRTVWSEPDGTFEVPGLPAPPWRVVAREPAYAPAQLDVFTAEGEAQVPLVPGARVSGSVIDERTGAPIAADVTLVRDDLPPEIRDTRTDADGAFAFDRIRAGAWSLRIASDTHLARDLDVNVVDRGRGPGDRALDPIRLDAAGRIEGMVVDALGAPLARATVAVAGDEGGPSTSTDTEGRFSLDGLPDGVFDVRAAHPAAGEVIEPRIRVYGGRETPGVVLHLPEHFDPARAEALPGRRRGVAARVMERGGAIRVRDVLPDSQAARAGLRPGDVLLEIDGDVPTSARNATNLLAGSPTVPAVIRVRRGEREALLVVERETWIPR